MSPIKGTDKLTTKYYFYNALQHFLLQTHQMMMASVVLINVNNLNSWFYLRGENPQEAQGKGFFPAWPSMWSFSRFLSAYARPQTSHTCGFDLLQVVKKAFVQLETKRLFSRDLGFPLIRSG